MRAIPWVLVGTLSQACTEPPIPPPRPATPAPISEAAPAAELDAPTEPIPTQELAPGVQIPKHFANGIPILTPWDFALLVLDPADLETTERRRRGYARRKVIMNNPDSAAARALNDLADAHQAGELDAPRKDSGVVFTLPGTKPTSGRPPAGVRPPPASTTPASGDG